VPWTLADSLFLVSILQFAGMAFLTIALMKKLKFNLPAMLITSLILSVIGGQLAKLDLSGSWLQYVLGLFFVTNDVTTFPLFRWLFYPVFGMIFGYFLQRAEDKNRFYISIFPVGLIGAIGFFHIYKAFGYDIRNMFMLSGRVYYSQSLLHHLFIGLVILAAMPVYYFLSVKVTARPIKTAVAYLGKNLDVIYLAQWMVICYVQSFFNIFGNFRLTIPYIIPMGILVLLASIGIIELIRFVKRKMAKNMASEEMKMTA
jgi:hypothetical protein